MSFFLQRFNDHEVHTVLKNLSDSIATDPVELPDTGPEREAYDRLKRVVQYTKAALEVADPLLT